MNDFHPENEKRTICLSVDDATSLGDPVEKWVSLQIRPRFRRADPASPLPRLLSSFPLFRSVCVCVRVRAWGVLCIVVFGRCGSISTKFRRRNFCKFIHHLILLERLSSFSCSSFRKTIQGKNGGGRMRELLAICLRFYLCLLQQRTANSETVQFFVLAMLLLHVLAGKFHRVTERFRMLEICL